MAHTIRYAEDGAGNYTLWEYWGTTTPRVVHGKLAQRPEWLVKLATLSRVGNYASILTNPPPELIVWATVDDQHNLVSFDTLED